MLSKRTFFYLLIVIIAYGVNKYLFTSKEASVVVATKYGKIQGLAGVSRGGKAFYEFLGVPYAQPPVGNLRFQAPQSPEPWNGIRETKAYGSECAQLRLITGAYGGEEDCLYLNIFTPKERKGLLPVMVFLHGGAFITGSSNGYRPRYFMDEDVVLVTVNYRLGALGFLNTGDEVVPGNSGLKDQTKALQFVQDNIELFGGDPSQVTLFGESAGSSSVSFHLLSPASKGLFHRAIMQSGVCTSNWSFYKKPKEQAQRYAKKFNCPTDDTKEMVKCMQKVDVKTFVQAHEEVMVSLREQITLFRPTIETVKSDSAFLLDDPMKMFKQGKIVNNVPVIAGVNSNEGLMSTAIIVFNQTKLNQANDDFEFWSSRVLNYPQEKTVAQKLRKFYFGDLPSIASEDLIENYTNIYSDRQFFVPLHDFASEYRKHGKTYLYYYSYEGEFSFFRILRAAHKPYLPAIANILLDFAVRWVQVNMLGMKLPHPGICHADELALFYDWMLSPEIKSSSIDYHMSKDIVRLWADFAKSKDNLKIRDVTWEPVSPKDKSLMYLDISANPKMIPEPFEDRIKFWSSLGI